MRHTVCNFMFTILGSLCSAVDGGPVVVVVNDGDMGLGKGIP